MADQLHPIPLVTPGFKGLNKAQSAVPDLDPSWATECQNFILDQSGRLAARQGLTFLGNASAYGSTSAVITEFVPLTGAPQVVTCGSGGVVTAGTTAPVNITGTWVTNNPVNPQFVNFNGALYGLNNSTIPTAMGKWTGSGNFANAPLAAPKSFTASIAAGNPAVMTVTAVASGVLGSGDIITAGAAPGTTIIAQTQGVTGGAGTYTVNISQTVGSGAMTVAAGVIPAGGIGMISAFGRLWVVNSDAQTISYCALLDASTWNGVGAGSLNMATVWTRGTDQIVGIAAAGNKLVVFGKKHIILFFDNTNPPIGLNPANISVYDTIEGTGLVGRDTIQATAEGELTFLSPTGIQSLARLINAGKQNPLKPLDPQVCDYINGFLANEDTTLIKSVYSAANRFYLLILPVSLRVFCYDLRFPLPDGSLRVTEWTGNTTLASVSRTNGDVVNIEGGAGGGIALYSGYSTFGNAYSVVYNSPWLAGFGSDAQLNTENRRKILKLLKAVFSFSNATTMTFLWGFDFGGLTNSRVAAVSGVLSEFNLAQFSINEFGGGSGLTVLRIPLAGSGRWVQFGFIGNILNSQLAMQQLDAFVKLGNMV